MKNKVEVLLSVMNIENEQQYKKLLERNKITGNVVAINQKENNLFNIEEGNKRLYSYNEKGASKSRNRLLEKAKGEICIFADDDTKYVENYEQIIEEEYEKNTEAEAIIFLVENKNSKREKIKKIGNKKINLLDVMKVRTCEISIKKEVLQKVKFDCNFGPKGTFKKGEETIFVAELLKSNVKVYSTNKKIATVSDTESTWFTGFNEKFLYDQGAIFYKIYPKIYIIMVFQYIIRKYFLYKNNVSIITAYKALMSGARKCKEMEIKWKSK